MSGLTTRLSHTFGDLNMAHQTKISMARYKKWASMLFMHTILIRRNIYTIIFILIKPRVKVRLVLGFADVYYGVSS